MNTSAIAWEGPLSTHKVAQQLIKMLFAFREQAPLEEEALRAEVLRVAVWEQSMLSQPQSLIEAQVSTQKVLRRARLLWKPISVALKKKHSSEESLVEDELSRQALDNLAEQGDLLSLPQGQWLPAPLRLVSISQDRYLLVGGVPSSLLARGIIQKLHLHSSFRQIDAGLVQMYSPFDGTAEPWQFQTQESWLGAPPLPFKELLRQFREIELLQQTTQYSAEAYVASLDQRQGKRWLPLDKIRKNGRYLLRSQKPWGQRFYTIGYIENHHIQKQSHILDSREIRRLCYALDNEAQMPTRVIWDKRDRVLTLESELPARERKRLATLGSLQTNSNGYYYPRIWRIPPRYEQDVRTILGELSIIIREVSR